MLHWCLSVNQMDPSYGHINYCALYIIVYCILLMVAFDRRWPDRIGYSGVFFVLQLSQPFTNTVSKFPMTKKSLAQHHDSLISHEPCSWNSTKRSYQTFLTDLTNASENQLSPTGTGKNGLHLSAPVRPLLLLEGLIPRKRLLLSFSVSGKGNLSSQFGSHSSFETKFPLRYTIYCKELLIFIF